MHETGKVVVISTAHVPAEAESVMNRDADGVTVDFPFTVFRGLYGWVLVLDELIDEQVLRESRHAAWLIPVVAFARSLGVTYVRFDGDGDVIESLPVFEELDAPAAAAA